MRPYEVIYILRPDLEENEADALVQRFEQVVRERGGLLEDTNRWGRRRLAYEIKDYQDGQYVVMSYRGDNALNLELGRLMKLNDGVLRHMVVARPETDEAAAEAGGEATEAAEADAAEAVPDAGAAALEAGADADDAEARAAAVADGQG